MKVNFKEGDRVRCINKQHKEIPFGSIGTVLKDHQIQERSYWEKDHWRTMGKQHGQRVRFDRSRYGFWFMYDDEIELEIHLAERIFKMRRRFILLKDSPELKSGALMEEKCDNGDQDFTCINYAESKQPQNTFSACVYSRKVVLEMPEWFEEVKPLWVRVADLSIFEDMLKKHKTAQ